MFSAFFAEIPRGPCHCSWHAQTQGKASEKEGTYTCDIASDSKLQNQIICFDVNRFDFLQPAPQTEEEKKEVRLEESWTRA